MSIVLSLLAVCPALGFAVAAVVARRAPRQATAWRVVRAATDASLVVAAVLIAARVVGDNHSTRLVRVDEITAIVAALVAFIGWVVVRFSTQYLAGDPDERGAASRFAATLAAVSLVVVANDIVVIALAWTATSLALHGLLTFHRDRAIAVAVAHKKFLLARIADASMLGAVVLLVAAFGSTRLDAMTAQARADGRLSTQAAIGAVLVVVAVILRSAQLPFHGWLIQVMEAPTPVSALLHAGVVNLGGVVALRLAPVIDLATAARAVLVVVGAVTAVLAALVMTTRVSIKVALAWSTCAQMGFMLVQCGLGMWEMAAVHLVAHSLYKAHAFLSAGGTVRSTQLRRLAGHVPAWTGRGLVLATVIAAVATAVVAAVWMQVPGTKELSTTAWVFVATVSLAVVPLAASGPGRPLERMARLVAVPVAYLTLHEVAARVVPAGREAPLALIVVFALAMVLLFVAQATIAVAADSTAVRWARPWFFRGFFLDEGFTRLAFAVWPPPPTTARIAHLPRPTATVDLSFLGGSTSSSASTPVSADL